MRKILLVIYLENNYPQHQYEKRLHTSSFKVGIPWYMVHFGLDMHLTSNFIYCKIQVADCALHLDIGPTHLFFIVVIRREEFFFSSKWQIFSTRLDIMSSKSRWVDPLFLVRFQYLKITTQKETSSSRQSIFHYVDIYFKLG